MNTHNHNPLFCAIPPYMVEEIANNGSKKQIAKAKKSLAQAHQFRQQRKSIAEITKKAQPVPGQKNRVIYDAQNTEDLPGKLVRSEGDAANEDMAVNEAYDGAGATYDLFFDIYNRNSIDNAGMQLTSIVHYLQGYDNAFWDGEQMIYGDGDEDLPEEERLFNRFTRSVDVIAHELTHGITQYEANLTYMGQPGALNESFSDVFGSLVKQRINNQTVEEADWLIGEDLLTKNVNGVAIRSMKAPGTAYSDPVLGKDPQPDHMDKYVTTAQDNGGVHINSGIPNKAFYAIAREIGGYAWEKAGKIWYVALCDKLTPMSNFQEAANLTYQAAAELFGKNSAEQNAVAKGWEEVGILVEADKKSGCNFLSRIFAKKKK